MKRAVILILMTVALASDARADIKPNPGPGRDPIDIVRRIIDRLRRHLPDDPGSRNPDRRIP
jgi:hypothetical protein